MSLRPPRQGSPNSFSACSRSFTFCTLPLAVMIEAAARRLRPLLRTVFFMPVLTSAVAVAVSLPHEPISHVIHAEFDGGVIEGRQGAVQAGVEALLCGE